MRHYRGQAYGANTSDWNLGSRSSSVMDGVCTAFLTKPRSPRATSSALSKRSAPSGSLLQLPMRRAGAHDFWHSEQRLPYTVCMENFVVELGDFITTSGIYRMNDHPGERSR
jgi:hypothetical protein